MSSEYLNFQLPPPENLSSQEKISSRSIWLAAILNILSPGLGAFYCGEFTMAIFFALGFPIAKVAMYIFSISLPGRFKVICIILFYLIAFLFLIASAIFIAHRRKKYKIKSYNKFYLYFLFAVMYYVCSYFIVESSINFKTGTEGMEKTMEATDIVMCRMNSYGLYIPLLDKKIINVSSPQTNDVVVYLLKEYLRVKIEELSYNRVIGIPGDTILIVNKNVTVNGRPEAANALYIYDDSKRDSAWGDPRIYPEFANWNLDFYGPLYIPGKNDEIKIDTANILYWRQLIIEENPFTPQDTDDEYSEKNYNESTIKTILKKGEYTVKNNYYFLLADNRTGYLDSRVLGLICEDDIVGKPEYVIFNAAPDLKPGEDTRAGKTIK